MNKETSVNKIDSPLSSAAEDLIHTRKIKSATPQTESPAYRLAYDDNDFILSDNMRSLRLSLELSKTDLTLHNRNINDTIVVFGSARITSPEIAEAKLRDLEFALKHSPENESLDDRISLARQDVVKSVYYKEARKLAAIITRESCAHHLPRLHIITGGGGGIMEAANRGATDAGGESIGLNITLPEEQLPNPYITPELCFQFHYFAIRKMHFLLRARALIIFPGGFGTLDELFDTLTLMQTKKIKPLPILIFGKNFWRKLVNFDFLVEEGMIRQEDKDLMTYVDSADEAWDIIEGYLGNKTIQSDIL
ncbi:MAG: hypothetical protein ACI9FB_002165 [Candidatus Azotimanducaceae bacterium]|jgi:uncharacterized protein (TIGR00730 family)